MISRDIFVFRYGDTMNFAKGGGVRDIYAPLELINCNVNAK